MYATVTQVRLKPGAGEQAESLWRDTMLPLLRGTPGFREALVLVHPDGERGMSVVIWESEQAMQAARESGLSERMIEQASHMFTAPPEQDRYRLVLEEHA